MSEATEKPVKLTDLFRDRATARDNCIESESRLAQARARLSAAEKAIDEALAEIIRDDGDGRAHPAVAKS